MDESKERLNRKRKDILAKVRSKEALHRQTEMLHKTEMVFSGHRNSGVELNGISNSGIESEESGDEHGSSELEEQLARMSLSATSSRSQPTTDDVVVGGLSPGRTLTKSSSLTSTQKTSDDAKKNRRTVLRSSAKTKEPVEDIPYTTA